jgi:hypothetical protein
MKAILVNNSQNTLFLKGLIFVHRKSITSLTLTLRFLGGCYYFEGDNMAGSVFNLFQPYYEISSFYFKKLSQGKEEKEKTFHNKDTLYMCKCTFILKRK